MPTSIASRFPKDFQEHAFTRAQNDREFLGSLEKLSNAEDIESLERFAKAYLGMFLDMDNSIPPNERIDVLANPELAAAIREGFAATLQLKDYPGASQIAATIEQNHLPLGYTLLAAMNSYTENRDYAIESLPDQTIIAAVCFHYAYKTESDDKWINDVLEKRPTLVTEAIHPFWQQLIKTGIDHLPGLVSIINSDRRQVILHDILIPVLHLWSGIRKKMLRQLLQNAFAFADHKALYDLAKEKIQSTSAIEPARYTLWLATVFLLAPEQYSMQLIDYCGRSKEKIIPLLDFCNLTLNDKAKQTVQLRPDSLCVLLRIIAPKITPQEDRYGALCDNSRKVLFLFYLLAMNTDSTKSAEVEKLLQVRVMKLYKPILAYQPKTTSVTLDEYIDFLLEHNLIRRRIKRYD